jgi:hypothetical protein
LIGPGRDSIDQLLNPSRFEDMLTEAFPRRHF